MTKHHIKENRKNNLLELKKGLKYKRNRMEINENQILKSL